MKAGHLTSIVALAALLAAAGCGLQKNMLYYPDKYVPSSTQLAAEGLGFWPSGPEGYRGFAGSAGGPVSEGTVVVFHGNAGTAADRSYYAKSLAPLGYRVILAEYPGYGGRDGEPGEKVFAKDAVETLRLARSYGGKLYVVGESLGCGVAASAAKQGAVPIDGLILITPWDTLGSVAKDKFPWLPVGLFLSDTYDTVGNLKEFPARIAIVGAERDQVIPFRHAETLFRALPGTKRIWAVGGAGHNDWPLMVDRGWWLEIMNFIRGAV